MPHSKKMASQLEQHLLCGKVKESTCYRQLTDKKKKQII